METLSPEEKLERVQALPAPTSGVVVTVPLMLWALYLQVHQIEPAQYRHPILLIKQKES
jgi:hypothetical protein